MLIGINGKISSGKDTAAGLIQELFPGNEFQIKKFAGALKQIASILTGIDQINFESQEFKKTYLGDEWGMTVRDLLQRLGTEAMRNGLHENVWVNALFSTFNEQSNWIITDVRFPNEYQAIRDRNGLLIRITRPGTDPGTHISETALDDFEFDIEIVNDGTIKELQEKLLREILIRYEISLNL